MRIYGGKDYYDSVVAFGQDPKTVLVRGQLPFPAEEVPLDVPTLDFEFGGRSYYTTSSWVIVVLCDKVYRGLQVSLHGVDHFFWSVDKLQAWAEENKITFSARRRWVYPRTDAGSGVTLENCMDVLPVSDALRQFMVTHRLAILLDVNPYGRNQQDIAANPATLNKYGFAKAVDPYTIFQELSMWISGVLGGMSPETALITDDKVLLEGHGFDKHSFRSSARA